MSNRPVPWSYAIQRWFDEKINFTYGEGPKYANAMIGHYTQVRETSEKRAVVNALEREPLQIWTDSTIESGGRSQVGKE